MEIDMKFYVYDLYEPSNNTKPFYGGKCKQYTIGSQQYDVHIREANSVIRNA